jgi:hypothetical protein
MDAYIITLGDGTRLVVVASSVSVVAKKLSELGHMFYDIEEVLGVII